MMILNMSNSVGTLELLPFDTDADPFEVSLLPGTLVLARCDSMSHKLFSSTTAYVLTCFLTEEPRTASRSATLVRQINATPAAKALEDWVDNRMRQIKEEEAALGNITKALSHEWTSMMNHAYHTTQRLAVRGAALRSSSSWNYVGWHMSMYSGPDFMTEVPIMRYNWEESYSPDENEWRQRKTFCKHMSYADGATLFDSKFFGLSNIEAQGMDIHQRWVLELGYVALANTGYKKGKLMNLLGGVYLGTGLTNFSMVSSIPTATGIATSINANRFSFCLGLKGPSLAIDTENASAQSAIHYGSEGITSRGRGVGNEFSLCGGTHFEVTANWKPQMQANGLLSRLGRNLTFDASADGYCAGDGSAFVVLKKSEEVIDNERLFIEDQPLLGLIAASRINQNGQTAVVGSPSGTSEQELYAETLKTGFLSPGDVEVIECNGDGRVIAEAVEVNSLQKVYRTESGSVPLMLTSCKGNTGSLMYGCGALHFVRLLLANTWGAVHPVVHLRQANPYYEWYDSEQLIATEAVEDDMIDSIFSGLTTRGFGGTNCHSILYGTLDAARMPDIHDEVLKHDKAQMLPLYWPGGGGELEDAAIPSRGYFILGSTTKWQPQPMQAEGDGVYAAIVILGDNRFEDFQICLDGSKAKLLYPAADKSGKGSACFGPDASPGGFGTGPCWRIDGFNDWARSFEALALEMNTPGPNRLSVTDGQADGPDAGGSVSSFLSGPKTSETGDMAEVGTKYKVSLSVKGRYRAVAWEKLSGQEGTPAPSVYEIRGDWNLNVRAPMVKTGDSWTCDVKLLSTHGEFTIVRNGDMRQVIHPDQPLSGPNAEGLGPDDIFETDGASWCLAGQAGDSYSITFKRTIGAEFADTKTVEWKKTGSEKLSKDDLNDAKQFKYALVGSWSGWADLNALEVESSTGGTGWDNKKVLKAYVYLNGVEEEDFVLSVNGSLSNVISQRSGEPWKVTSENAKSGDVFCITVNTVGSLVASVVVAKSTEQVKGEILSR
jgi:3-oxoacyl-(acyl-carrier-protein) synthase